jgi:ATPase subunit of ABC transporter with duplicated ATPase domains
MANDKKGIAREKMVEIAFSLKSPYGDKDIFIDSKLTIEAGKRAALYGINGSGKTCLFDAISSGDLVEFPKVCPSGLTHAAPLCPPHEGVGA